MSNNAYIALRNSRILFVPTTGPVEALQTRILCFTTEFDNWSGRIIGKSLEDYFHGILPTLLRE